ncbi:glycosyl transferase family protein, partial [mine drainage metagenome]
GPLIGDNIGWGESNNLGTLYANGEYLFFSGPDMEFKKGWLPSLESLYTNNVNIGSAGTVVSRIDANGSIKFTGGINLKFGGLVNQFCDFKYSLNLAKPLKIYVDSVLYPFIKKETLFMVGGFDPHYFYWEDDVDLGIRLKKMGLKTL